MGFSAEVRWPLTPEQVLKGYRMGFFPMAPGRNSSEIHWFSPDPRGVLPLDRFRIPRTLARLYRQGRFEVRYNTAFEAVIRACADRAETWISERIIAVYGELHRQGWAHSVESWRQGQLVGGLYGVSIGGAFFGESMFHRERDASKVALVALVERLRARGFALLDVQWVTPHLARFGAVAIPRSAYLGLLQDALRLPVRFV
ncbi:MAG: leucyl/phenylalanyl-tRNA--protein transferase [Bacteroidetes bacterium]|nr:leucyl/phenylalanyl-tRNA--protein transferase [Rhodothermia bacterium]MCX7907370.1 leucyl/phenylalanyl-tRNA--protein transferase [Bacteroidota bacterium]MDW8284699.1 leucyl/phenylalanyl-tRNA--protein transferase [Bacteroidota bacterium]